MQPPHQDDTVILMRTFLCISLLTALLIPTTAQATGEQRIYYYGDSIGAESFGYFDQTMSRKTTWNSVDRTIPGSSPCDWYSRLSADMKIGVPRVIVIEAFGNNISSCQLRSGRRAPSDTQAYWQQYQSDLDNLVSRAPSNLPIWLSPAAAARNDLLSGSSHEAKMLQVMQVVAASHSNLHVIRAGLAVDGPGGTYAYSASCLSLEPCSNQPGIGQNILHAHDGLHFCPAIYNATIDLLRHCPVYASGAYRFGNAQAQAVISGLGLQSAARH